MSIFDYFLNSCKMLEQIFETLELHSKIKKNKYFINILYNISQCKTLRYFFEHNIKESKMGFSKFLNSHKSKNASRIIKESNKRIRKSSRRIHESDDDEEETMTLDDVRDLINSARTENVIFFVYHNDGNSYMKIESDEFDDFARSYIDTYSAFSFLRQYGDCDLAGFVDNYGDYYDDDSAIVKEALEIVDGADSVDDLDISDLT